MNTLDTAVEGALLTVPREIVSLASSGSLSPEPAEAVVNGHWGELLQVGIKDELTGATVTALVTLPDPKIFTRASAIPAPPGTIVCRPAGKVKAEAAIGRVLREWGSGVCGAEVRVRSNAPVGIGAGSSTLDCTACAFATVRMLGVPEVVAPTLEILRLAVFGAEGPCDPLALLGWGLPVLWASRDGQLLRAYTSPLPSMIALCFTLDSRRRVSTVELARNTRYSERDLNEGAKILRLFEQGLRNNSADLVGQAATWSGDLNQSRCPVPGWKALLETCERVGAAGLSCSHSGSATALLWAADRKDLSKRIAEARALLLRMGAEYLHSFDVGRRSLKRTDPLL